jgi:hypothetical protein
MSSTHSALSGHGHNFKIKSLSSTEAGSKRFQASKRKQLKFFAA